MNDSNPFSGLFGAPDNVSRNESAKAIETPTENVLQTKINRLIEKIFLFTIRKNPGNAKQLVFMEEIAAHTNTELLSLELLEQALFERLLLSSPLDYVIPSDRVDDVTAVVTETKVITYLYRAFEVSENSRNINDSVITEVCEKIRALIMRNVSTAMRQPELFEGQSLSNQWLDILRDLDNDLEIKQKFLIDAAKELLVDEEITAMGTLKAMFYPMFAEIQRILKTSNMITLEKWIIPVLRMFTVDKSVPSLSELVLDFCTPNPNAEGSKYADTMFGQLLSLSILPKTEGGRYEFYSNPMESLTGNLNASLWTNLATHLDSIHMVFKSLLVQSGVVRDRTLAWLGNCIHANAKRGQIWNAHSFPMGSGANNTASDSFMIGLCGVMLRLCVPLFKPQYRVMLVDPTYCAVPESEVQEKCVHMKKGYEETCLLPTEHDETRQTGEKYNFITECFFLTHKAIDLSYRVCIEKFIRMSRDIYRLQTAYQNSVNQEGPHSAENIQQILTSQLQVFMCLKNTIVEPFNDSLLVKFYDATSNWLLQVTSRNEDNIAEMVTKKNFAPLKLNTIKIPLTNSVPAYLKCIPEFVLENVIGYLVFIRHFEAEAFELDYEAQNSIFTMILLFMGSSDRVRNPHLRARLAEGLESLLPKEIVNSSRPPFKTRIFDFHPDRLEIVPNLLHVFVGIEMTGQSVQFEQKFNYRRPMYAIMEFLWEKEEQREIFKKLAKEAELNIEAFDPPIFLRFINLLINDAIFLLDESLSNLQQIRTLQAARDNGEWSTLPTSEQQQNNSNLQHLGMMARFDNILGRDTINIIKLITGDIKEIFCHASMVDRIAAMLNYFLLKLVGPQKSSFQVKDKKELEFDPANTVLNICRIYVNLQNSDAFCWAVSQDGRSYSNDLFQFAEQILIRIGGGQLIGELNEFACKVKYVQKQREQDQQALTDPPDEFLDPIMSSLMLDPVLLPSSHVTVDRSTIARHLLSDQSDPFNRSPLTMDQVKPNIELKREIDVWMEKKRKEYLEKHSSTSSEKTE